MENPVQSAPQPSNTGRTIAIAAIVIVALMCCCAVAVIALLTIMGPVVGKTFSSINQSIEMTAMPAFPTISPDMTLPSMPTMSPDMTMPSISDVIPTGGNGDDTQRASAWTYVIIQTATDGCSYNPKASATTIKVTQEADSKGVWAEEWTVTCDNETKNTYTVTFTPGANGNTDIKVK